MLDPAMQRVRIASRELSVRVLPEKGGDIVSVVWAPQGLELLWQSPWNPWREGPVAAPRREDPAGSFLSVYPGGWQTIFPNGGDACLDQGSRLDFHGEAAIVPYEIKGQSVSDIELSARLTSMPFEISKKVVVDGNSMHVVESATNRSSQTWEVMWSHHPAFGAPFLSDACEVTAAATGFVVDDERDAEFGDLVPGSVSRWPEAAARSGGTADLRMVPSERDRLDRFGYLTGFTEGLITITDPLHGITVELRWDAELFPYAWYWLEAHATDGYPWMGEAYVLGLEPASSYPGQGIAAVRKKNGPLLSFAPGETKTIALSLTVGPIR